MSRPLEPFYTEYFDIATIISFATNLITIPLILKYTPKNMKHYSHMLLNAICWSFLGSSVWMLFRFYPMFPLMCFAMDGPIGSYLPGEVYGHIIYFTIFLTIVNIAISFFISFQFRYMSMLRHSRLKSVSPRWGYLYGVLLHLFFSILYTVTYILWIVPVEEYPSTIHPDLKNSMFCFHPTGIRKHLFIGSVAFAILFAMASNVFIIEIFKMVVFNKQKVSHRTAQMQKSLFWNLMVITTFPFVMGGLPVIAKMIIFNCPDWDHAVTAYALGTISVFSYSPIMNASCILMFRCYRRGAVNMVRILLLRKPIEETNMMFQVTTVAVTK